MVPRVHPKRAIDSYGGKRLALPVRNLTRVVGKSGGYRHALTEGHALQAALLPLHYLVRQTFATS